MKLFIISAIVFCVSLSLVIGSNDLEDSGLLEQSRGRCAKPDESCSKGRMGSGPYECCAPKGCSCNPFTRNCDCKWDSVSHTAGEAWGWVKDKFGG